MHVIEIRTSDPEENIDLKVPASSPDEALAHCILGLEKWENCPDTVWGHGS
jgi:hypothetical protein